MSNLHVIEPRPSQNADAITKLEEALIMARNGEIVAVGMALIHKDGATGTCWSSAPNIAALIGALERLKYRLLKIGED